MAGKLIDRGGYEDESLIRTGYQATPISRRETVSFPMQETVQADDRLNRFYRPVDSYEGRHRYDADFEWGPSEEKKVVKQIDWRIMSWICLMFFALQLDRGNISQALSDDMLDDLSLSTNEYNVGQTIYLVCFIFAELPSQLVAKKLGSDTWIPIQMVSWSILATLQAGIYGRVSFWITRGLIGLFEGGFIPTVILYLSYWYTSAELPVRLSFFWMTFQATSIVSALLAYGILHMRGFVGLEGWRWLFALEGILTGVIGTVSYFYLPPSPTQTASSFRGKDGWFSLREEKIMVNRILRDDPSKGDMHNREALTFSMLHQCITDYHMWPIYLLALSWEVPKVPIAQYITLNLRAAGFDTFQVNLLTIPAYVLWIVNLLFFTKLSEKLNERFLLSTLGQIWMLPVLIALTCLPSTRSRWITWLLSILHYAQPYIQAILVGLISRNAGSVRTRTVAAALYNMCLQTSGIIGSNIYRTQDAPYYYTGNKILIGVTVYNLVVLVVTKIFYMTVNRRRERVWRAFSEEEKVQYLASTKEQGNKRLDFRFTH